MRKLDAFALAVLVAMVIQDVYYYATRRSSNAAR